jgi:hypothetical protein
MISQLSVEASLVSRQAPLWVAAIPTREFCWWKRKLALRNIKPAGTVESFIPAFITNREA